MKKLQGMAVVLALLLLGISQMNFTGKPSIDKAGLGKLLFFDPILSSDRTLSCASCHKPAFAFADTSALSLGVLGRKGTRNTPSAMNVALQASYFWDGRAATLEEQALAPIANPVEMNLPLDSAVARLTTNSFYKNGFREVFNELPNTKNLAAAIASFERTLETNDTPFDDWKLNENEKAVSVSAKRGYELFNNKAKCVLCHFGPDFNNVEFRNIGLFDGKTLNDSGRAAITKKASDLGKFKIGPLRNIALTAPYMHNGLLKTLKEVIDFYDDPEKVVPNAMNRDTILAHPLKLTIQEKKDLENFLVSLTDRQFSQKIMKHTNKIINRKM